ncbi:MAG: transcription antitermination factor NusB [Parachlamydiaceae bacterium]
MAITHQKFREIVFLLMYRNDFAQTEDIDNISLIMEQLAVTRKNVLDAAERSRAIRQHLDEIDAKIAEASTSYEFDRIQVIERNILRLGAFELLHDKNIPPKVAIAEALRLTKKFGTSASTSFVNAVLDHLYKKSMGIECSEDAIRQAVFNMNKSEEEALRQQRDATNLSDE